MSMGLGHGMKVYVRGGAHKSLLPFLNVHGVG